VFCKASGKKRKAFYPFANGKPDISCLVTIHSLDFEDPKKNDITLQLESATGQEELDNWRDVYGVDERHQPSYIHYDFLRIPFLEACFVKGYIK